MNKKAPLAIIFAVILLSSIICGAWARTYILTRTTYMPSLSGATITFHASLMPITLTTYYKYGTFWNLNDTAITTTVDMTITALNVDDWFNCTLSGAGIQKIDFAAIPTSVYLNGYGKIEGDGWTRSGDVVTVTGAASSIAISYAESEFPETDYTYPDYDRDTIITGGNFQIFFNTTQTLSFSGNLEQQIYFNVLNDEWNGTSCRLNVWERSGVFVFHSETNTTLLAYSNGTGSIDLDATNIQVVQLNGTAYNLTITENNDCSITWQMKGGYSWVDWIWALGIAGAVLMIASVVYFAFKLRGGIRYMDEIVERGYFALILFIIGFCLVLVWLGVYL